MRPNGLEGVMTLKIRYKKKELRIKRSEYESVGGCCSYGRRNTTIDCVITRASCGCGNICDLLLFLYYYSLYYRGVRGVLFTLYCT